MLHVRRITTSNVATAAVRSACSMPTTAARSSVMLMNMHGNKIHRTASASASSSSRQQHQRSLCNRRLFSSSPPRQQSISHSRDGNLQVESHLAYTVLDSTQPSSSSSASLLITCEHASSAMPAPWSWLSADEHLRSQHWASDPGALEFTYDLARRIRSVSVLSTYSRLLCDPNRPVGSETMFRTTADGHQIALNQSQSLTPKDKQMRLEMLYEPYHQTLQTQFAKHQPSLVLSAHSFTPVYEGVKREVEIGVLYNNDHDLPLANHFLRAFTAAGIKTGLNIPWSAKDGFAYAADQFSSDRTGVIMFEFRQDLIVDEVWRKKVVDITEKVLREEGHKGTEANATSSSSSSSSSSINTNLTPAFAFDIDGVLLRGRTLLPTARSALLRVTSTERGGLHKGGGIPHVFLTNGGGVTEDVKATQLSKYFGLDISPEEIILSHSPMRDLLPRYKDSLILAVGMTDVRKVALSYGFKHVLTTSDIIHKHPELVPHLIWKGGGSIKREMHELAFGEPVVKYDQELQKIEAILVMHDPVEWYRDLQVVLDLITLPRPLNTPMPHIYFSNPDFLFSGSHTHPRLAAGAWRICLEALYKEYTNGEKLLEHTLYGKPHNVTYKYAENILRAQAKRNNQRITQFHMIGDNPAADIRGANQAGEHWTSVFVKTGSLPLSKHPMEQPKMIAECVEEAVETVLRKEERSN